MGGEAFRWTTSGMVSLGSSTDLAYGVSGDGSVAVGKTGIALFGNAFRWSQSSGVQEFSSLLGGSGSTANDISGDGLTLVGTSKTAAGFEAFRFISGVEIIGLGDLPGGDFNSHAFGVSGNGLVVVGTGTTTSEQVAFIWDSANGIRELQDELTSLGLDLDGWTLETATDISSDGLTIVGFGTNPDGNTEAWIATIPEPNTALLLSLGLTGLAAKGRRSLRS